MNLELSEPVRRALAAGRPVVALESTIVAHGFPRPRNLEVGRLLERTLADSAVTPATVAVVDGTPRVGLTERELERIATDDGVVKASARDLPAAIALRRTAATTVAATSALASLAGIRVFATGGLGGVHRGAAASYDESADLTGLSRTRITVVCAGVKSVLDIPATLERLESYEVTVLGYRTEKFPAFWLADSGCPVDWRVETPADVAGVMAAADRLGRRSAIVVANPIPSDMQLDPALHDRALSESLAAADRAGITGKAVTPFLLDHIRRATGGRSLDVNVEIARGNAALAAEIATSWAAHHATR